MFVRTRGSGYILIALLINRIGLFALPLSYCFYVFQKTLNL
jgi:hypothetical protein